MDDPQAVINGVLEMLFAEHGADIERLTIASAMGLPTSIWWDEEAETLRFEVLDDAGQRLKGDWKAP